MKYVLDTNVVSLLMRGDPEVSRQLTSRSRTDVFLPHPVIAEIEYGLARLPRSARRRRLRERFDVYGSELRHVHWTDDVSKRFGEIKAQLEHHGTPIEDFDVAVAAHALSIGATLVTENLEHMRRVRGLRLESWR